MAPEPYFQVSVPTTHREQPGRHGLHIFTGPASSSEEALHCARESCNAALVAQGRDIDREPPSPIRWRARGVCQEWVMDWKAATVDFWHNEKSLDYPFPIVCTRS